MEILISFCGLDCGGCPAYQAARDNDDALREKTARQWSKAYNAEIKPEDINCQGCRTDSPEKFGHCAVCKIRSCAPQRGYENCAPCPEYPCEDLAYVLEAAPETKARLEAIRRELFEQ